MCPPWLAACSTQDEPAYCGLASLAMVLNTLSIDPRRTWKVKDHSSLLFIDGGGACLVGGRWHEAGLAAPGRCLACISGSNLHHVLLAGLQGPWRWFHEEMLDCCHPLSKVREEGITLEQVRCAALCC